MALIIVGFNRLGNVTRTAFSIKEFIDGVAEEVVRTEVAVDPCDPDALYCEDCWEPIGHYYDARHCGRCDGSFHGECAGEHECEEG